MKLLIATRNAHKLDEIRAILSRPGLTLLGVAELGRPLPEVVEDAGTFTGNALKKARMLCAASELWTLADDSGLEVDALDGAPGVYSARYGGESAGDAANNARLLRELDGVEDRRARFRCVLALAAPDGRDWTVEGCCEGRIAHAPSGTGGFGYDPLFHPVGATRSFAELTPAEKNRISHRARALAAAARAWQALLVQ
jgi:XTP/dITP diphosphohydrolase